MTLVEFLEARVAEDEADAQLALRNQEPGEPWDWDTVPGEGLHINRWDPDRVLAECEAKRRIVEGYLMRLDQAASHPRGEVLGYHATGMGVAIRLLAVPYSDHPDYRSEWRP